MQILLIQLWFEKLQWCFHTASGVKYAWRDGNLHWKGERWLQVLGTVSCSQDSGIAIQAVTPARRRSLARCSILVGDFSTSVHLLIAYLLDPGCHHSHPGKILFLLCPQGPQRTCLDQPYPSCLCAPPLWWKTAEPTHLHQGPDP